MILNLTSPVKKRSIKSEEKQQRNIKQKELNIKTYLKKMTSMHKESYECVVSDLDLTATPPTQTSVESASIVEHIPIHTLTHGAPIEFVSYGAGDHYRDLSDMHLGLKCRVRKNK